MEYCPHCMRPAEGAVCPHCGGEIHWQNPDHLLPVGTVLKGAGHTYELGAHLGQGGFGVTYIALELESGRRTAIKEYFPTRCCRRGRGGQVEPLPGQEEVYEGGRYHFLQEARMLASLEGMPSVVQGLDYLETNNTAYLMMEYLDGTPLYRIVNQKGRIAAGDLLPRLEPLLRDIGKLHAAGVVHRDISPDNVMWMNDGTLKLLDFGSARSMEDGKSMTVLLKHGFAPVEQYQTHGQGPWTDVYALSATVYYCLTGVVPPTSTERLQGDTLQPPASLGAALTPEEEAALLWGLTVRPKDRPADMEAFRRRLFPAAAVTVTQAAPDQRGEPAAEETPAKTRKSLLPSQEEMRQMTPAERIKSMWWLLLLAAAALCIAVALMVSLMGGMGRASRSEAMPDTAGGGSIAEGLGGQTPAEEGRTVTDRGLVYRIENGEATLTGCEELGEKGTVYLPPDVEDCPVTAIAPGALAGLEVRSVYLPRSVTEVGDGAFRDCKSLEGVLLSGSSVRFGADCFAGCDGMRYFGIDGGETDMELPEGCFVFDSVLPDRGVGAITSLYVAENGALYANAVLTDTVSGDFTGYALLDVLPETEELVVPETIEDGLAPSAPVYYVARHALQRAEGLKKITVPDSVFLDQKLSILLDADEDIEVVLNPNTPAANWYYTGILAELVNYMRDEKGIEGQRNMTADPGLLQVSTVRAGELTEKFAHERPDGSSWDSLMYEDYDCDLPEWNYVNTYIDRQKAGETRQDAIYGALVNIAETYTEASNDGLYDHIGFSTAESPDGTTYMCAFTTIP